MSASEPASSRNLKKTCGLLTCEGSTSTGVINCINDGCIPFLLDGSRVLVRNPKTEGVTTSMNLALVPDCDASCIEVYGRRTENHNISTLYDFWWRNVYRKWKNTLHSRLTTDFFFFKSTCHSSRFLLGKTPVCSLTGVNIINPVNHL